MAEFNPFGIDPLTGKTRQITSNDSIADNIGDKVVARTYNFGDFSDGASFFQPIYPWGEGAVKLDDPASIPALGSGQGVWSSGGEFFARTTGASSPWLYIYQRTGTTFTKLDDPASAPAAGTNGVHFSADSQFLAIAESGTGDRLITYQRDGSTFTRLAAPSSVPNIPGQVATSCRFSPNGQFLALTTNGSGVDRRPYLWIYERDGTTFTKLNDPSSLPEALENGRSVDWSPDGQFLALGTELTPFIRIYQRTGLTDFTLLPSPASLPTGAIFQLRWSPCGNFLAAAGNAGFDLYQRDGTNLTRLPDPASLLGSTQSSVAWSPDSKFLFTGFTNYNMFERSGSTFTRIANPATIPGSGIDSAEWSPDGQFVAMLSQNVPRTAIYQAPSAIPSPSIVISRKDTPSIVTAIDGLALWLDAAELDTILFGESNAVATWEDKAGLRNVSQSTANLRPELIRDAFNEMPALDFPTGLGTASKALTSSNVLTGTSGEIFAVYKLDGGSQGTRTVISQGLASSNNPLIAARATDISIPYDNLEWFHRNGGTNEFISGTTSVASGVPYVGHWRSSGTAYGMRVNGVEQGSFSGTDNGNWWGDDGGSSDRLTIGAISVFAIQTIQELYGKLAEIIVYDGVTLTAAQREAIEKYLRLKWLFSF